MAMSTLREMNLIDAAVPRRATFADAARVLCATEVSAIAVLDERRRVVGLFTDDDMLRGTFPGYIGDLHHTAFLDHDVAALAAQLEKAGSEPVERHMRKPTTVDADSDGAHVAERFLHCEWRALAVVEDQRFLGMLNQVEFCRSLLRRAESSAS